MPSYYEIEAAVAVETARCFSHLGMPLARGEYTVESGYLEQLEELIMDNLSYLIRVRFSRMEGYSVKEITTALPHDDEALISAIHAQGELGEGDYTTEEIEQYYEALLNDAILIRCKDVILIHLGQ